MQRFGILLGFVCVAVAVFFVADAGSYAPHLFLKYDATSDSVSLVKRVNPSGVGDVVVPLLYFTQGGGLGFGKDQTGAPIVEALVDAQGKSQIRLGPHTTVSQAGINAQGKAISADSTTVRQVVAQEVVVQSGNSIFIMADDNETWLHLQGNAKGVLRATPLTPAQAQANGLKKPQG
jgi:hypothetical protein